MDLSKFAIFIISHGRCDNIKTLKTLQSTDYKGKVYIVIDDQDKTKDKYLDKYGSNCIVFNKKEIAKTTDQGDNFNNLRTTTHARNACFDIANNLGLDNFLVFDDDYTSLRFRFDNNFEYIDGCKKIKSFNKVIYSAIKFLNETPLICFAFAQGGDFIGGKENRYAKEIYPIRKIMNSFFCSTKKPFKFFSRLNEDVNTYITLGSRGNLFITSSQCSIEQVQTQASKGGMTEAYLDNGTYVKSFYSVMYQPSSVKIMFLNTSNKRIHHSISHGNTYPLIVSESVKKK